LPGDFRADIGLELMIGGYHLPALRGGNYGRSLAKRAGRG
jgi:hypothetical protein